MIEENLNVETVTGIDPFIIREKDIPKSYKYIFLPFAILKLPIAFILLTYTFFCSLLVSYIPFPPVRSLLSRFISYITYLSVQISFNLFNSRTETIPLAGLYRDEIDYVYPKPGDLIISNLNGYLGVLYLNYLYSPLFAIPIGEDNVKLYSGIQLIISIMLNYRLASVGKTVKLSNAIRIAKTQYKTSLLIFPEGNCTNGEVIINFKDFSKNLELNNAEVHLVAVCNSGLITTPAFTNGNCIYHMISLLGQFGNEIVVWKALPQDVPKIKGRLDKDYIEKCRKIIAKLASIPLCNVNGGDGEKYLALPSTLSL